MGVKTGDKQDIVDCRYHFLAGGVSSVLYTFGYKEHEDFDIQFTECYGEPIFIFKKDILPANVLAKLADWVSSFGLDEELYIIKDSTEANRPSVDNNFITLMIR